MHYLKFFYITVGLVALGAVFLVVDFTETWHIVQQLRWGFAAILALYMVEFIADSMGWQLTFQTIPLNFSWFFRLWKIKMVGEAFNLATPLAHMGGEPVKALLLKRHFDISYAESIASLILSRTTIVIALVVFLSLGFMVMLGSPLLLTGYQWTAGFGLILFNAAILLLFLLQRFKWTSRIGRTLFRGRFSKALDQLHIVEARLVEFYTTQTARFSGAFLCCFINWAFGVVTLFVTFQLLGTPISLEEAWIIETFTQLVRATTFFVPANLGTQEGALVLITSTVTGNPSLGLAVALVRRGRELVWVAWGLFMGWRFAQRLPQSAPTG